MSAILWVLVIGLLIFWWIRLVVRGGHGCCGGGGRNPSRREESPFPRAWTREVDTAVDPVCGMTLDKEAASATRRLAGTTYYFCSDRCAETFDVDPRHHATGPGSPAGDGQRTSAAFNR